MQILANIGLLALPMVLIVGAGVALSCCFLKTCPHCRLRIPSRATRCAWCATWQAKSCAPSIR
jgi:hypothetical protein